MHKSIIPSISEPAAHSVIVPNSAIIFAHRVNSEITSGQKSHDSLRLPSFDARSNSISRNEDLHHNGRSVASIDQGASAQSSKSDTSSHLLSGGCMSFERMVNSPMHEFSPPLPPFRRKSDSDAPVRSPPGIFLSPSSTPVSPNSPGNLKKESKVVDDEELKFCSPNSPDSNATTSPESVLSPMSSDSPLPPATPVSSPPSYLPTSPEGPSRQGGDDENYIRVRPHLASPPSGQGSPCMICGDKSTGKHYGAHSCDGCKGFFRRSIRKCHNYSCRFDRTCNVTKDRRNQCRYCRLHKCLEVGMKKEAVQNERDRISQRRTPASSCPPTPQPQSPPQPERGGGGGITVEILLKAEEVFKQINEKRLEEMQSELSKKGLMMESARGAAGTASFVAPFSHCDVASLEDVAESVKQQLYGLVDFARAIPQFNALNLEDKIKLLKAHSGEHLLLGIAWRSLSTDGFLVLGINKLIPRLETGVTVPHGRLNNTTADQSTSISWIASRVLDDIVGPLRQHKVNALEFLCLRTMIFFDPMLHGLVDRNLIQQNRLEVQLLLEDLISKRPDVPARGRLGQIMFILPYLQTISGAMTQQIQLVKKDGVQSIDQIIPEMLLGCFPEDEREEGHESLTSPMMRMIPPPPSRSRARDFENERRSSDSLDRRSMRSPTSMEPCDLSYHPQQQDVINHSSDPREQNLSDVHNQPPTHVRQNGYSRLPHARVPDHDQTHIREYYVRDQQPFMSEDVCQAQDLEGSHKNGSMSGVNGSYRMDHVNDYSNQKLYALRGAENLTAVEVSRDYVDQDQWRLPSSALIDLSNSNAQNGLQGNRNSQSPLESMEHSSVECMDTTPLDCSDRNHSQRMRDAFVGHRPPSLTQGRDQLIHHTSKVLSNGLLTQNNGLLLDRNSSHVLAKESNFGVGSDDHSMLGSTLESSEEFRGVVVMGPVRADPYGSFEPCNRSLVRVRDASRSVDCSSPHLPLNLRQRLSER